MRERLAMWGAFALMALGLSGCFYQDLEVLAVDDFSPVSYTHLTLPTKA